MSSTVMDLERPTREGTPPGPWNPFPWLRLARAYRKDPLGHLERMAATHGDIVYARVGWYRTFLLNHPDHVEHVLLRARKNYRKDPLLRRLRPLLGDGLLVSEGATWKSQRKIMAGAFTPVRVARSYAPTMLEAAATTARGWAERAETVVDVGQAMTRLTLDVAVRTLFGSHEFADTERVGRAFTVASHFYGRQIGTLRFPEWVPTPANLEVKRALATLDEVVARIVAERRGEAQGDDLLGTLLAAGMEPALLRDEVLTLLLAGHETTSLLLTYTLFLLARAPEVQASLREELAPLDDARATSSPRMRQVLREALRLYPPAAILGREAIEEDAIGGWRVPKGALVFLPQWVIHRDPRFYDDPRAFRPDRWTPAFEQQLPRFAYFPFGGGERICIGEEFALLEASLALATLIRRFRFACVDSGPLEVVPEITMRPVRPVVLRLTRL